jgi:hypothetical protein
MIYKLCAGLVFALAVVAPAQAERPNLVPNGWRQVSPPEGMVGRRFVSPDGRGSMMAWQTAANRSDRRGDLDRLASRDGERITYRQRGTNWIVVSGYRGDDIFYRKSNLACGGTRWNTIEFEYPRSEKLKMDSAVTSIQRAMTRYSDQCDTASR